MSISNLYLLHNMMGELFKLTVHDFNENDTVSFINKLNRMQDDYEYSSLSLAAYIAESTKENLVKLLDECAKSGKKIWDGYLFKTFLKEKLKLIKFILIKILV